MEYRVSKAAKAVCYILFILWCMIVILSLVWILLTSFKTNKELYQEIWKLPGSFNLDNYKKIYKNNEYKTRKFKNGKMEKPNNR